MCPCELKMFRFRNCLVGLHLHRGMCLAVPYQSRADVRRRALTARRANGTNERAAGAGGSRVEAGTSLQRQPNVRSCLGSAKRTSSSKLGRRQCSVHGVLL